MNSTSDPVREYMAKKNAVLRALRSDLFLKYFGGRLGEDIRRSVNILFRDLDALASNRRAAPTQDEARVVALTIRSLADYLMHQPISPFVANFSRDYAEVVKNWNDQTVRARDIQQFSEFVVRLTMDYLTMNELVAVLRSFVPRMERLLRYTPPAFELSRHYLELILKKHESGQPINEYEAARAGRGADPKSKKRKGVGRSNEK